MNMEETPTLKVQYEYQNPNNVESEVPGSQNIREVTEESRDENTEAETHNGGYTITRSSITELNETVEGTKITKTTVTLSRNSISEEQVTEEKTDIVSEETKEVSEKNQHEDIRPKTKIPKLKFRQAAERVRSERRKAKGKTENETHIPLPKSSNSKLTRISKIPPPTSKPFIVKRETKEAEVNKPDEELDKIYEEIIENTQTEIEIKNPEIIENKFEEIIHDYDENKIQPINVEKVRRSRIPAFRRRTSEQAHSQTEKHVLSEKIKTRSLPRLKEISMRVKADDENLSQMKLSRSISTEAAAQAVARGQKNTVETRIAKRPGMDTKITRVTRETITGGKASKNKDTEVTFESVTMQNIASNEGNALDEIDKKFEQSEIISENIMKNSIIIDYTAFKSKEIEDIKESNKKETEIQVIENVNVGNNIGNTNSNLQSSAATKISVTKLTQKHEVFSEAKDKADSNIYIKEIKDESPTVERFVSITCVVSSNNDKKTENESDSPESPTEVKDNDTEITTENNDVISSSNNEKEKEAEVNNLSMENNKNGIIEVPTEPKYTDVQNTSHFIECSENKTHTNASIGVKVERMEYNETLSVLKEISTDKDTARQTIIKAISSQISENKEDYTSNSLSMGENIGNVESYEVEKRANVEGQTAVIGKVGKLIHRIDTNEVTTETIRKGLDDLPKKKSILSKIALFERQDVNDLTPIRKPGKLSKLVIKPTPPTVTHTHTPTIVEEVLKTKTNTPLTANIQDVGSLNTEIMSFDYKFSTVIEQGETGKTEKLINEDSTLNVSTNEDPNPVQNNEVTTFDYKVSADEYNQIVEMTKVKSNDITQDDIIESASAAILDCKLEAEVNETNAQDEKEKTYNENSILVTEENKDEIRALPATVATMDYKLKEVKKLASEYEQKVEVSKDTSKLIAKDIKKDNSMKPGSVVTFDYKLKAFDGKDSNKSYQKAETIKQISTITTVNSDDIALLEPAPIFPLSNKLNVDDNNKEEKDETAGEKTSSITIDDNMDISATTEQPTTFEYTFKDVKKLATEYEQRFKSSKSIGLSTRFDTLSPLQINSDSNSNSNEIVDSEKVIIDAPVILISPKIDFLGQMNIDLNEPANKVEIANSRVEEAVVQQTAERTEIMQQINTEYKGHQIENRKENIQNGISNVLKTVNFLETARTRDISRIKSVDTKTQIVKDERNYRNKVVERINDISKVTQPATRNSSDSTMNNIKEAKLEENKSIEEHKRNIEILDITQDYKEVKTKKSKGYVIKQEGDLAYAQIQDDNYSDSTATIEEAPKLPKTPPPKTPSSITTKRLKSIDEKKKYYADVDINTVIKGKVSRMISRMTSIDQQGTEKKIINVKEMPRKLSVLEKIAMFEKKISADQREYSYVGRTRSERPKVEVRNMTQEEFDERVAELKSARLAHGRIEHVPHILLRNGVEMPVLALGTAMLDPRLIPYVVGAAIDLGYRAIDTAYIYGNEKEIGEAIRAKIADGTVRREELFIISKLWSTFHRTDLVETACRSSLETMGLDYFDLYLIHNPMSFKEGGDAIPKIATVLQYSQFDYLDAWYGMEQLMTKGLVRSIGVSNFNSAQLQRVLDKGKIKPTVNQVECHPYLSQLKLEAFCEEKGIKLSCFGVLGSKGTPPEYRSTLPPAIDDPLVQVMASGLDVSPAQLLIRYQLDCGRNVVVKTSSAKRLWENLQALTFNLTQGQVDALHALNRNKRTFTFIGMGDTHKNYPFRTAF